MKLNPLGKTQLMDRADILFHGSNGAAVQGILFIRASAKEGSYSGWNY